jgi:8-oxo-dGTP pyrophosphatase MutT (NUDIX family)
MTTPILALLDEIRAIGQLGMNYSEDPFDRERYERLVHLASGEYAAISGLPESEVDALFRRELGYITPKTGCNGAVFNPQGQVLLVKRSDNGLWCLPGGYAEVNMTPQDNCRREVWEETGLEVEVGDLVDVFCTLPGQYSLPNTVYILVYLCNVTGGTLTPSHETPVVGFYDHTSVTDWHTNHAERVERAYRYWIKHYRL